MEQEFQPRIYTQLQDDDVLLGRGTGPNDFEGNIRFRQLVGEVAKASSHSEFSTGKATLARKVVDAVNRRGGRFVRKLNKAEATALINSAISSSADAAAATTRDRREKKKRKHKEDE